MKNNKKTHCHQFKIVSLSFSLFQNAIKFLFNFIGFLSVWFNLFFFYSREITIWKCNLFIYFFLSLFQHDFRPVNSIIFPAFRKSAMRTSYLRNHLYSNRNWAAKKGDSTRSTVQPTVRRWKINIEHGFYWAMWSERDERQCNLNGMLADGVRNAFNGYVQCHSAMFDVRNVKL